MVVSLGAVFVMTILISQLVMSYGVPFTSYGGSYAYQREAILEDLGIIADLNKDRVIQGIQDIRSHVIDLARAKKARTVTNPQTKQKLNIPETKAPKFTAAKALKESIK